MFQKALASNLNLAAGRKIVLLVLPQEEQGEVVKTYKQAFHEGRQLF